MVGQARRCVKAAGREPAPAATKLILDIEAKGRPAIPSGAGEERKR
jgi:hypothetical protein